MESARPSVFTASNDEGISFLIEHLYTLSIYFLWEPFIGFQMTWAQPENVYTSAGNGKPILYLFI